jgi:arginyl-tRNA synthetase
VVRRTNGVLTYFAADIAYHRNKCERGYEMLVDIWGADHHGYIPRVRAAMAAQGFEPDMLKVLLVQLVNLMDAGEKKAMSTRAGEFVTLRELMDDVGSDAARFIFLTRKCDSKLDFDMALARSQTRTIRCSMCSMPMRVLPVYSGMQRRLQFPCLILRMSIFQNSPNRKR